MPQERFQVVLDDRAERLLPKPSRAVPADRKRHQLSQHGCIVVPRHFLPSLAEALDKNLAKRVEADIP
jgi:hypothetical protein